MPRKRLTLEALVEEGRLDARNWRHRRALDESREPLADAELEETRQPRSATAASAAPKRGPLRHYVSSRGW
jgi:hypothetical protein